MAGGAVLQEPGRVPSSVVDAVIDGLAAEAVAAAKTVKLDDFAATDDNTDLDGSGAKHGLYPKADATKLSGVAAGADVTGSNAPQVHKISHQDGGADEVSVAALSGLLADDQHVLDAEAVSAVEVAGLTFAENKGIILDAALSADGKYSGITEVGVAGTALAFGDLVYLAVADSRWELTDADAEATAGPVKIGICVLVAGADGNATVILLWGKVRADTAFPALTIGAAVYAGLTPGAIVTTAPSATADIVRIIGYGNTQNELHFCPDNTYVEIT